MNASDEFLKPVFKIGGTEFRVEKLKAMEGWDVIESIRHEFGKVDTPDTTGKSQDQAMLAYIARFPKPFVAQIRQVMFGQVFFKNENAQTWQILKGAEDTAFKDLEPVCVGEVLVRALCVNFTGSFSRLANLNSSLEAPSIE